MKNPARPLNIQPLVFAGPGGGPNCALALVGMLGCLSFAPVRAADFPVASVAGFNAAVTSAQPGDTITLADGTWANTDLVFKGDGTPTSPITLRAQTPGRVFLTGLTRMQLSGS